MCWLSPASARSHPADCKTEPGVFLSPSTPEFLYNPPTPAPYTVLLLFVENAWGKEGGWCVSVPATNEVVSRGGWGGFSPVWHPLQVEGDIRGPCEWEDPCHLLEPGRGGLCARCRQSPRRRPPLWWSRPEVTQGAGGLHPFCRMRCGLHVLLSSSQGSTSDPRFFHLALSWEPLLHPVVCIQLFRS